MRSLTRLQAHAAADFLLLISYFILSSIIHESSDMLRQDSAHLPEAAAGVGVSWPAVEAALTTDPHRLPPALLADVPRPLEGLVFGPASQQPLNLSWSPPNFECETPRPAGQPPRRIIDVVPFSYELDVLELRLHELNATVDLFVVVEAPVTHRGLRKPLVFAQHAKRFVAFADKIVHVVVPHAALREPLHEALHSRWRQDAFYTIQIAVQQAGWAAAMAHVHAEEDLLILADVDELPGADLLYELKWCSHRRAFPLLLYSSFYRFDFSRRLGSGFGLGLGLG